MHIVNNIFRAREAFIEQYKIPPLSIFLTKEELQQLNRTIHNKWAYDKMHNIKTAMRPNLLPNIQLPDEIHFGDRLFNMIIIQRELFYDYHLA